jgi:hypothetical protein
MKESSNLESGLSFREEFTAPETAENKANQPSPEKPTK